MPSVRKNYAIMGTWINSPQLVYKKLSRINHVINIGEYIADNYKCSANFIKPMRANNISAIVHFQGNGWNAKNAKYPQKSKVMKNIH